MRRTHQRGTPNFTLFPLFFGALALVLSACSSDSEVAARKAAEAGALFDTGRLYEARQAALASVKARDDISANWILLGRIQLASGLVGDGYVSYTRALELDATNVEAMLLVAEIALQVGRFRDAEKTADQVLALQPDAERAKIVKGFVALNDGKLDVAGKAADEVLKVNPTTDGGVVLKARVLGKSGDFAGAVRLLENQLLIGKSELVLATLVEIQRAAGNGSGLAAALTTLIEQRPTDERVFDLAGVLYKIGKPQAARDLIFKRLEARKDSSDFYADATAFLIATDPAAFDAARIAQIARYGTPQMRELAARVLLADGRPQEARTVIQPIFETTTDPDLRALYATALAATGTLAQVPPIIDAILRTDETNVDALILRARIRLTGGDEQGALADAALIGRDSPLSIDGRMVTIDTYLRRGDKQRARQLFEEAVRAMPKNLEMTKRYLGFLAAERDLTRAAQIVSNYNSFNPSRIKGWDTLLSLCPDDECRARATAGRTRAAKLFPADEFVGRKAAGGMFGPL